MDFTRIFETIYYQKDKYPNEQCLAFKSNGSWVKLSTDQLIEAIHKLSNYLLRNDYKKGDIACIFSAKGNANWMIADMALQQSGITVVPLHSNYRKDEIEFILKQTGAVLCFAGSLVEANTIRSSKEDISIICLEKQNEYPFLSDMLENEKEEIPSVPIIDEEGLATIIYTSGSTGLPKGVMLSHRNMVSNIKSIMSTNPLPKKYIGASYLPLSHVFERVTIYSYMAMGVSVHFISDISEFITDLKSIRPHIMTSVPRILERTYDYIVRELEDKRFIGKFIGNWALAKGRKIDLSTKFNFFDWFKIKLADLLVYSQWRKALGGRLKKIVVGAASMDPDLARLYSAAGIEVREGYGLTETSPAVSFNRFEPGGNRFGTVGIAIPGVEVKILNPDEEGEGEICVRGPNVMMGYFKNPEKTKEVIDEDGWLHTGDIGKFVEKRFLKITDRKKNIFKTSSGRYVAPQVLEQQLKRNAYINQCMVIGFQRPEVSVMIVPHFGRLKAWCEKNDIHWTSEQFMVLNPKVMEFYMEAVDRINASLKPHEKMRKILLLHKEWSVEDGELSSTMKLRRQVIIEKYQKEIDALYSQRTR